MNSSKSEPNRAGIPCPRCGGSVLRKWDTLACIQCSWESEQPQVLRKAVNQ